MKGIRIETLTARSIAGLLHDGKLSSSQVFQILEEGGFDDKIERIHDLMMDMEATKLHYENKDR